MNKMRKNKLKKLIHNNKKNKFKKIEKNVLN